MRDHRKLRAFHVADALVVEIYRLTMCFPRSELFGFTAQMRRAVVSTASNIVEGSSRRSQSDYVRFLEISLGSAKELGYQLELAERLGFLGIGETAQASEACSELIRLLAGLVRAFDARELGTRSSL